MAAGRPAYLYGRTPVEINAGRDRACVRVSNTGDRAVQVGSHYHFFEANRALDFDRAQAYGMHLDLPAGTAVRFEPGDTRDVDLVAFAGNRRLVGFSGLVDGGLNAADTRAKALHRAADLGFLGARRPGDLPAVGDAAADGDALKDALKDGQDEKGGEL